MSALACADIDDGLLDSLRPDAGTSLDASSPPPPANADAATGGRDAGPDAAPPSDAGAADAGDAAADAELPVECIPNPDLEDEVCTEICPEVCNGQDDDCDLRIDETSGLTPCGLDHAMSACILGECTIVGCETGFEDCDDMVDNGCEADLGGLEHCGGCGQVCAIDDATAICDEGVCSVGECAAGFDDCDADGLDCEADLSQPATCGSCDNACSFGNAEALCVAGGCLRGACNVGFADCDFEPNDCEQDLSATGACPSPSFVAGEAAAGSAVSSLTLDRPAGTQAGDLLVAWLAVSAPDTDATPLRIAAPVPGGTGADAWTPSQDTPSGYGAPRMRARMFWKLVGQGEPADYSFGFGTTAEASGVMAAFRGVDPREPVDQGAFEVISASSNDINGPERVPVRSGSTVVAMAAGSQTDATGFTSVGEYGGPVGGYVIHAETGTGTPTGTLVGLASQPAPTPFTTDPMFSFAGDPADQTVGATLVLNPVPVTPPPAPDVWVRVGSFTTPAAAGNFDVTGLGRDDVKGLLMWAVGNATEGGAASPHMVTARGIAATAPNEGRTAGAWAEDGAADVLRYRDEAAALQIYTENATAPTVAASFAGAIADGFRLDFSAVSAGFVVNYVAFGGADCEADIAQAAGGSAVATAVEPELAFAFGANLGAGSGNDGANLNLSFGAFNHLAGAWALLQAHEEANGQAIARLRPGAFGGQVVPGNIPATLTWERVFEEVNPANVEYFDNNGVNGDVLYYLVLDLGGLRTVVRSLPHRAGADNARQDLGLPFTPQAVFLATAGATDGRIDAYNSDRASFGASDGARQVATCGWAETGTTSRSQRHFDAAVIGSGPGCDPGDPDLGVRAVMDGSGALRWQDNTDQPVLLGLVAIEDPTG